MNCNTTHYRANSSSVPGDPTRFGSFGFCCILWRPPTGRNGCTLTRIHCTFVARGSRNSKRKANGWFLGRRLRKQIPFTMVRKGQAKGLGPIRFTLELIFQQRFGGLTCSGHFVITSAFYVSLLLLERQRILLIRSNVKRSSLTTSEYCHPKKTYLET